MRIVVIKILVLLLCVPAYPFITIGAYVERSSYLGSTATFGKVSREYWADVWDALTYRKGAK